MSGLTDSQIKYLECAASIPTTLSFRIWDLGPKQTGDALKRRGFIAQIDYAMTYRITNAGRAALGMHKDTRIDLAYLILATIDEDYGFPVQLTRGTRDEATHAIEDLTFDEICKTAIDCCILTRTTNAPGFFKVILVTMANGRPTRLEYVCTIKKPK